MVKRNGGTSKEDICQNQFTAYVVLAVKRKRQAYIKKKVRDKENQAKREEEQSNFGAEENTVWDRLEVQNEELVAAVQQLKPKARFIVTGRFNFWDWTSSSKHCRNILICMSLLYHTVKEGLDSRIGVEIVLNIFHCFLA